SAYVAGILTSASVMGTSCGSGSGAADDSGAPGCPQPRKSKITSSEHGRTSMSASLRERARSSAGKDNRERSREKLRREARPSAHGAQHRTEVPRSPSWDGRRAHQPAAGPLSAAARTAAAAAAEL